jgi:hypothetical protein
LEASPTETREYAALAANAIVDEGFVAFAEGASVPHGAGSRTVAGGHPVPGFLAYLRHQAPPDAEGRLDAFDEIFDRFVEATAVVESETGPGGNAAYNRSMNAAEEIFEQFFAERTEDTVRQLHRGFGDPSTPIDMSRVTTASAAGGGCALTLALGAVVLLSADRLGGRSR